MPLDHNIIGVPGEPVEFAWSKKDAILYALGVGAGLATPYDELSFTTENSTGLEQYMLPTYGVLFTQNSSPPGLGNLDLTKVLHAEQGITLHSPMPVEGRVSLCSTVQGIFDKGSGALVSVITKATDTATGSPLVTARTGVFIRGEGGFGGDRGPPSAPAMPDRAADHVVRFATLPGQALIYRLSGDDNRLHSDPEFARRSGFDRPILHGLCTYGFAARALLRALCGGDPKRFRSMDGRFSSVVFPGDELVTSIWREDDCGARFQVAKTDGTVVLDKGKASFVPSGQSDDQEGIVKRDP